MLDRLDSFLRLSKRLQRDLLAVQPTELPSVAALQALRAVAAEKKSDRRTNALIARHLGITEPSASSLVSTLLKLKLVTRTSAYNERAKSLELTEKGRRALKAGTKAWSERGARLFGELSAKNQELMFRDVEVLNEHYNHRDHLDWLDAQADSVRVQDTVDHWSATKRRAVVSGLRKKAQRLRDAEA